MPLNPDQEKVASHYKHRVLVLAGPGSGKTSTITERVSRLIAKGVRPVNILNLSFTNKAAGEFKQRVTEKVGENGRLIKTCTFHSLCVEILRIFGDRIGYDRNLTILDSDESESLMAAIARQKFADDETIQITKPKVRKLCAVCNDWRESDQPASALYDYVDSEAINEDELSVIKDYIKRLKAKNQIDFSGLLSETIRLLKADEEVCDKLRERFQFIQVDEYQDTNVAQNVIVELLAGDEDNVLAVGDGDQSIYEWRGANPESINTYINNGKGKHGCEQHRLGINYRSCPEIIEAADRLIRHNTKRVAIEFSAANKSIGKPPVVESYPNPEVEAAAIATGIARWVEKGISPSDIAVLYRLNDMSRPIEQALVAKQVPYKVYGGMGFYDRMVVKDCLAMLRIVSNRKDGSAFSRLAKLKKGVGEKAIGGIENYAGAYDVDVIEACEQSSQYIKQKASATAVREFGRMFKVSPEGRKPSEVLSDLLLATQYREFIDSNDKDEKKEDRIRHINELLVGIGRWEEGNPSGDVSEYLQWVTLLTSSDETAKKAHVSLMTGHAAKGLEFRVVIIVGAEDTFYPHERSVRERLDDGVQEERRLFYVMMTRAKQFLLTTWCRQRKVFNKKDKMKNAMRTPSRFLVEAGMMSVEDKGRYEKLAVLS